eukprot:1157543-Pelagomonas_calceolata.AAC.6
MKGKNAQQQIEKEEAYTFHGHKGSGTGTVLFFLSPAHETFHSLALIRKHNASQVKKSDSIYELGCSKEDGVRGLRIVS